MHIQTRNPASRSFFFTQGEPEPPPQETEDKSKVPERPKGKLQQDKDVSEIPIQMGFGAGLPPARRQ